MTGEQLFKALCTSMLSGEEAPDFKSKQMQKFWQKYQQNLPGIFGAGKPWTEVTVLPGNTRQVLMLRNGVRIRDLIAYPMGLLGRLKGTPEEKLEELFLAILTRFPFEEEKTRYLGKSPLDRSTWEDIAWTLLNSTEFSLRH